MEIGNDVERDSGKGVGAGPVLGMLVLLGGFIACVVSLFSALFYLTIAGLILMVLGFAVVVWIRWRRRRSRRR